MTGKGGGGEEEGLKINIDYLYSHTHTHTERTIWQVLELFTPISLVILAGTFLSLPPLRDTQQ